MMNIRKIVEEEVKKVLLEEYSSVQELSNIVVNHFNGDFRKLFNIMISNMELYEVRQLMGKIINKYNIGVEG